jgi:hypothetical protein
LVRRKYRQLFSSRRCPNKPGPKGPHEAVIQTIVEIKSRNPRFGCPRIARIVSQTFGITIDKNVVYRVLAKHYRPVPGGTGPSWLSNGRDLARKLAEFQIYYNAARCHASLDGRTPLTFVGGQATVPADLKRVRWVSHCRGLVQLPAAA